MKNLKIKLLIISVITLMSAILAEAKVYDFTEGNKLTLLNDTRVSFAMKLQLIRNAKHHIHIMTYYWDKFGYPIELLQELRNAHERGVNVRIMTTYLPSLSRDFWGKSRKVLFSGDSRNDSSATLSLMKLVPGNNETITNSIHEKVFIIDGEKAIIGGRNISDFSYTAKDLEVMLEGPVVNQVQEHFRKMFSFLVDLKIERTCIEEELGRCQKRLNKLKYDVSDKGFFPEQPIYETGAKARILTNEVLFAQNANNYYGAEKFKLKDDIIDTVINTKFDRMRTYNYFIIPTDRYKDFLIKNAKAGKKIEIITNSMSSSSATSSKGYLYGLPETLKLINNGIDIHQWVSNIPQDGGGDKLSYLHEKVMLFDDDHGIIGSHNFGAGSTSVSSEISIEFFSKPIVGTLNSIFDSEIANKEVTIEATPELIESEIHDNHKMIKVLRSALFRNFIKEIF